METWKDIKGYEGLYQVSDLGRIKSLIKNKILKQPKDRYGYLFVTLYTNKIPKIHKSHRLVALNFIENKEGLLQVDHIDRDKTNNNLTNLRWCSSRDNISFYKIKDSRKTSKYIGVSFCNRRKMFVAQIGIGKLKKHLGYFDNELDAHLKYESFKNSICQ